MKRMKRLLCEALELRRMFSGTTSLRVVTYNILADIYSQGLVSSPQPQMETVLEGIGNEVVAGASRPIDILALQETASNSQTVAPLVTYLNNHYGAGTYAASPLQALSSGNTNGNGPNALIYNTTTLTLISSVMVASPATNGPPRAPVRYEFRPAGGTAADDFYVYNSHYKSGDEGTGSNAIRRQAEAQAIRANEATLPASSHVLYVGDYNVFYASELGYQAITAPGVGQAIDPINSPLFHGSSTPRATKTNSPSSLSSRLDLQLVTSNVMNDTGGLRYRAGSYHAFGNDGSVNDVSQSTTALSSLPNRTTVLNDLTIVSDHLPVVADYLLTVNTPVIGSLSATPASAPSGTSVMLAAANVTGNGGATINGVSFYRESNGISGLQIGSDTLVGAGSANGTTWSTNTSTTGFAAGNYTYYAYATDNYGTNSITSSTGVTVSVPSIGSFTASPTTVTAGNPVTLTASNVTEAGGTISGVGFYRESNGTAGLQIGSDTYVGAGAQNSTTWTATTSTSGFSAGTYTYYAVATDANGATSSTSSASVSVSLFSQPLFNVQILASTNPSGPFSSSLIVQPGMTYYYELVGQLAPVGTSNVQGSTTRTITSIVDGTDGANSLSFDLLNSGSSALQTSFTTATLATTATNPASAASWSAGSGATAGTIQSSGGGTNNQLAASRPAHATNVQTGSLASDVIEFGSFVVAANAAPGSSTQIAGAFSGATSQLKINGGSTTIFVSSSTETSGSPIVGYTPLSLSIPIPTIGSLSVNPTSVEIGDSATLSAHNVTENGGTVSSVTFYRESNGITGLQIGSDTLVGSGIQNGSDWSASTSTTGLTAGTYTYYAVPTDSNNISGAASSTTLTVTAPSLPLYNLQMLASTSINGPYSSTLTVMPGQSYYFEIVGELAPIGTSNTQGSSTRTITSRVAGTDGANSLTFNWLGLGSNDIRTSFQSVALAGPSTNPSSVADWAGSASATPGTIVSSGGGLNNKISGAHSGHASGVFTGTSADVIEYGVFTIDANAPLGVTSQLVGAYGDFAGSLKINGGTTVFVTSTTENGASPLIGYLPLTISTPSLPAWLAPGSQATWDSGNQILNVTGTATIIADPAGYGDFPAISATSAADNLVVDPTNSDTLIHIASLALSGGATTTVDSVVLSRSHTNHLALVIGSSSVAGALSVDSSSKLDLVDNDLIVHHGILSAVQSLAAAGRNVAPGGTADGSWDGNGLTSSAAASLFAQDGYELTALAVVRNGDLPLGSFNDWHLGAHDEALAADDLIVKYTYTGDVAFSGAVDTDATVILGALYDNGATSGHGWWEGDLNGDGLIDTTDDVVLNALYGNGELVGPRL